MKHQKIVALVSLAVTQATLAYVSTIPGTIGRGRAQLAASSTISDSNDSPKLLNVCVVGGGPCGLLVSHLLLQQPNTRVSIIEGRSDPRIPQSLDSRAYAFGVGIRGRTAIRAVDDDLWEAVKARGFESERFQLHAGPFIIPLRSEMDVQGANGAGRVEPSVLIFQSSLCGALVDELDSRHGSSGRLQMGFKQTVKSCDLKNMKITKSGPNENDKDVAEGPFDLIIGCDGVNSIVRKSVGSEFDAFETQRESLPGEFKVVRLDAAPSKVDPLAVSLVFPKAGRITAFVEPTDNKGGCCVLFAGQADDPILANTQDREAMNEALLAAFPQWAGDTLDSIAVQLMKQTKSGSASSITCNTYNFGGKAVLAGDAAHATGGVSGQGVNSALQDAVVLVDCITQNRNDLPVALLEYSKKQVPEGKALYDLSFGPKPKGIQGLKWAFLNARDTLFRGKFNIGKQLLQTRLTTSLEPFSDIRRESDNFYESAFPAIEDFHTKLEELQSKSLEASTTKVMAEP